MICFFSYSWSRCVDHDIYLLTYILDLDVSITIRFFIFLSFLMHNIYFYVYVERGDYAWYASSPLILCHLLLIRTVFVVSMYPSWYAFPHNICEPDVLIMHDMLLHWFRAIFSSYLLFIFVISMCPSWYASPNILYLVEIMALHWFHAIHDESSLFCGGYARHRAISKSFPKAYCYCLYVDRYR